MKKNPKKQWVKKNKWAGKAEKGLGDVDFPLTPSSALFISLPLPSVLQAAVSLWQMQFGVIVACHTLGKKKHSDV